MKVVYLIGNGFDLNLGLKTSYSDFYTYYLNIESNNIQIAQLKEHLKHDKDNEGRYQYWSDLEIAMGEYTKEFSRREDMEKVYNDLNDNLRDYIMKVEQDNIQSDIDKKDKLKIDLAHPERYLREIFKEEFRSFVKKWETSTYETFIISFNYTNTIEAILNMNGSGHIEIGQTIYNRSNLLYPVIHIHGLSNTPIIGLNDVSQIRNESFKKDEDAQEFLLKPKINKAIGHLIDRKSLEYISQASLIYLFGVSLGETDKLWWEAVGERLKRDCRIIYFVYNPNEHPRPNELTRIRRKYKEILLSKTKLTSEEKQVAFDRIFIVHNSDMFNLKKR